LQGAPRGGVASLGRPPGLGRVDLGPDLGIEAPSAANPFGLQHSDHGRDLGVGIAGWRRNAGQSRRHVEPPVERLVRGTAQPVAGAVGLEPDRDQLHRADRAQGQGSGHLAREQRLRLQTEDAVGALLLIRAADVEDQFGAAVRRDPLHGARRRRRGVGPEGSHEGTQGRGRCVLLIPFLPRPHGHDLS
jgi:hypothetical protein